MDDATETPPTISTQMIRDLADVVGEEFLVVEREKVDAFKDVYWFPGDDTYAASAVVQPSTTEQVQEILRVANRYGIPVWPHGQGRNLGHGGPSPRVRGSIQLGMQRMNRILEINEEMAYAVVEPGVTWFDLYEAVQGASFDLMTPCPDLGWGSIIGNSMDSGHTYQQYGPDYMFPTGFEVVLPDGDLLRTGQGAIPDSTSFHLYKRSLGPSLDPLFIQSNLGIVTRMGVWLKRRPAAYAPVVLHIDEDEDFEQAIDAVRELRLAGHLEGIPAIYSTMRACQMVRDAPVAAGALPFTSDELREIARQAGVGAWSARTAVWGDRDIVEVRLRRIREAWARIPSGRVEAPRVYAPDEYDQFTTSAQQITAGIPTLAAWESTPPWVAHVDVSPVVPLRGEELRRIVQRVREVFATAGLNFGMGIMVTGERSAVPIAGVRYDLRDEANIRAAFELARTLVVELGAMGYGDGRPHLEFMDLASDLRSFNDHAHRRFVETIKDAVDPKGILSPGRHGIWPAAYRAG